MTMGWVVLSHTALLRIQWLQMVLKQHEFIVLKDTTEAHAILENPEYALNWRALYMVCVSNKINMVEDQPQVTTWLHIGTSLTSQLEIDLCATPS